MMKHIWNENELTLYPAGELNSNNADSVHKEILAIIGGHKPSKLVMNLSDIVYVSSAGLRVFLSLKKAYPGFCLAEASIDVYDVLQMTGFTSIMEVSRKLQEVDVTGMKVIGEGRTGIVYRINKDTILKVYKRKVDIKDIEKEMALSRESFVLGIPTAITFDIVKVGDHLGSRFEMLDCDTLDEVIRKDKAHLQDHIASYAGLLKTIHGTTSDTLELPKKKQKWKEYFSHCAELLPKEKGEKLLSMLSALPDSKTFIHGDCHIKNIMSDGKSLFLIDMGSLSTGYPIFDFAALYRTFFCFDFVEEGNASAFFELDRDTLDAIYFGVLQDYFGFPLSKGYQNKIALAGIAYLLSWAYRFEGKESPRCLDAAKRLEGLLDEVDDLFLPL